MKDTALLLIAIVITIAGFMPLVVMQSLARNKFTRGEYHYNIAVHIDYLWASLIFGRSADGHTVSALVYKDNIVWAVKAINWMFNDATHCQHSYYNEFLEENNA